MAEEIISAALAKGLFLATAESLIGSTWAAFACLAIGYIAGHLVPLGTIAGWIRGTKG